MSGVVIDFVADFGFGIGCMSQQGFDSLKLLPTNQLYRVLAQGILLLPTATTMSRCADSML